MRGRGIVSFIFTTRVLVYIVLIFAARLFKAYGHVQESKCIFSAMTLFWSLFFFALLIVFVVSASQV